MEKQVFFEVVEAQLEEAYAIFEHILAYGYGPDQLEEDARKDCNDFNLQERKEKHLKGQLYKVVKITIEEVTSLKDAEDYLAGE